MGYYTLTINNNSSKTQTVACNTSSGNVTRNISAKSNASISYVQSASYTIVSGTGCYVNNSKTTETSIKLDNNTTIRYEDKYTIIVITSPKEGGTVTGSGSYYPNDIVTLVAYYNTGYIFQGWYKGTTKKSNDYVYKFNANSSTAGTYTAKFSKQTYTIVVDRSPQNGGTVTGSGTYESGKTITITASPNSGYYFAGWSGGVNDPSSASTTVTVTGNAKYTANFRKNQYIIITNVNPQNGGTVIGSGTYDSDAPVTLTATPNFGYDFDGWDDGKKSNPRSFTASASTAGTYIANFTPKKYNVTLNPNGGVWEDGKTSDIAALTVGKEKTFGDPAKLVSTIPITTEKKKKGYKFLGWSTDKNATIAVYKAGSTFDDGVVQYRNRIENVLLYAVWEPIDKSNNFNYYKSPNASEYITENEKYNITKYTWDWSAPSDDEWGENVSFLGWVEIDKNDTDTLNQWKTSKGKYNSTDDIPEKLRSYTNPYIVNTTKITLEEWNNESSLPPKDLYGLWIKTGKFIKINGKWKDVNTLYMKINDKWKPINEWKINIEGEWKKEVD